MRIDIDFEMDAEGVRAQGARVIGLAESAGNVVVDLRHVTRLDSSGIGLLVHLQKRKLEGRREFVVENANGQPRDLLKRLNLLDVWSAQKSGRRGRAVKKPTPILQN